MGRLNKFSGTGYLSLVPNFTPALLPGVPGGSSTQKFDELFIQASFRIFVVYEFDDGSVYTLGSTEWDIDGVIGTKLNGTGPDKRDVTIDKSEINWSGSFEKGDEKPAKMIPPNAIDALQPIAK